MRGRTLTCLTQRAFASQVQNHGFDPKDAIIEIAPREGEFTLREEDILDVIEKEGSNIALVLFGALSYFTGQLYPMKSITKAAKAKVRSSRSEICGAEAYGLPPGMHVRMGLGSRGRQRNTVFTRLGRRLCRLVHLQVPELWTWRGRRFVCPREVARGNTQVSHCRYAALVFS